MAECAVPTAFPGETFDEVYQAMQADKYWINFFVRPCCPAPGAEQALQMLDKRRDEVRARADYTDEQKAQLLDVIDQRQQWYVSSPFCHG